MKPDPLLDDILKGMYREKMRGQNPFTNPPPQMSNEAKVAEMCRRVDIPVAVGNEIRYMAMICALKVGRSPDMVLVAKAIKYAGDNKERLKRT